MTTKFLSLLRFLPNIGIEPAMSDKEIAKARIYNYLILTLLIIQSLLLIREVVTQDPIGLTIISTFCTISISFLFLHYRFGLDTSAGALNTIYPLAMGTYLLMIGRNEGVEYSFFVFMLSSIIFQKNALFSAFLIAYNISIFIFANLYIDEYGILLDRGKDKEEDDYMVIFIAASICFALIMYVYNQALEKYDQKSSELIDSLQNKNDKLITSNQELERFTYIASHDLKTPLRNIVSFLGVMERQVKEGKTEDLEKYFSIVTDNARNLYDLIEETLEYSKIGQQEWKSEAIDLNALAQKIKEQLQDTSSEEISIEFPELPIIQGDDFFVYKLFFNIIENGIKYNHSQPKKVSVQSKEHPNHYEISITDNGIGIPQEYLQQIFIMYKRLHTRDNFQGTGIGLSMSKKIIEKMGGQIWVKSTPNKGSTFYFTIPKSPKLDHSKNFITPRTEE
jgi:signal transduction histidine kinase